MKSKKYLVPFLFLICLCSLNGRAQTIEEMFAPKMPTQIDTLYFPFYNGVQMIELDHIGYWDRKIFFLEQSQPRAMPHSMFHPQPLGNEYYFRDSTGTIVKAFNTAHTTAQLTTHFAATPINARSKGILAFMPYHSQRSFTSQGVWAYSPQSMFQFNGYYKIATHPAWTTTQRFETKKENTIRFGLIDTLGNIRVPLEYEEILPLNEDLMVMLNGKWGIVDINRKVIVPAQHDSYDNYYSEPKNNKLICFRINAKFVAVYNVLTKTTIQLDNYDDVYDHYVAFGYLLIRNNNLFGLVDMNGKVVLPIIYDRVNNVNRPDCTFKNCVSVVKDGKTFDLELKR